MPRRPRPKESTLLPELRRAPLRELAIFEVSESELETIRRGGASDSIYLNFAIALLSIAVSLLGTLITANIQSPKIFASLVACVLVGFIVGAVLLLVWYRSHTSIADLVNTIRKRLPPEGIATPLEPENTSTDRK